MTNAQAWVAPLTAFAGFAIARVVLPIRIRRAPEALVRVNVEGRPVPAVLADPLLAGGIVALAGLAAVAALEPEVAFPRTFLAVGVIAVALGSAGRWDDLRGDEIERGFKGHLRAASRGTLTGGGVKIVAGAAAGLLAGAVVAHGWTVLEVGVLVALTANLLNLLDRAPGRAGKVTVAVGVVLAAFGSVRWTLGAAGLMGALVACLPADLRARAMLGDAGANPLGGVLGLGLALTLARPGRLAAIAMLVALTGLSERYSFSAAIERTPLLRTLDMLGRGRSRGESQGK